MPAFNFYGYTVRPARLEDAALAHEWMDADPFHENTMDPRAGFFWVRHSPTTESYLVLRGVLALAFYQVDLVDNQRAQLYLQSRPLNTLSSRKAVMLGVTRLVPLLEKALAYRGVKTTFFVSQSPRMCDFMRDHLGYQASPNNAGFMEKQIGRQT